MSDMKSTINFGYLIFLSVENDFSCFKYSIYRPNIQHFKAENFCFYIYVLPSPEYGNSGNRQGFVLRRLCILSQKSKLQRLLVLLLLHRTPVSW